MDQGMPSLAPRKVCQGLLLFNALLPRKFSNCYLVSANIPAHVHLFFRRDFKFRKGYSSFEVLLAVDGDYHEALG